MTSEEVYTLASIVEREISRDEEKQRVAGLYLNRLRIGMKLDADPTAKFATKDFKATRILYKHIRRAYIRYQENRKIIRSLQK